MSDYVTYVIRLPDNPESRIAFTSDLRAMVEERGGEITGLSNTDEMTVLDMIEQHEDFSDHIADESREKAAALIAGFKN